MENGQVCTFAWIRRQCIRLSLLILITLTMYGLLLISGQSLSMPSVLWERMKMISNISKSIMAQNASSSGISNLTGSIFTNNAIGHTSAPVFSNINADNVRQNYHPYKFIIDEPEFCPNHNSDPLLLAMVFTHPANFDQRMAIRNTWGTNKSYGQLDSNVKMKVIFAVGDIPDLPKLMEKLKNESNQYKDIIQEDFLESYRNLTLKAIMCMKWASIYCRNAFNILKVDDDVFVNRYNILKLMRTYYDQHSAAVRKSFTCQVLTDRGVYRNKNSKWYVSYQDYPNEKFHTYCLGAAYMMSGNLPGLLYNISLRTKPIPVEDVYLTGIVTQKIKGITYLDIQSKLWMPIRPLNISRAQEFAHDGFFMHMNPGAGSQQIYKWWHAMGQYNGLMTTSATMASIPAGKHVVALGDLLKSGTKTTLTTAL